MRTRQALSGLLAPRLAVDDGTPALIRYTIGHRKHKQGDATITFAIADFESHEAEFAALRARANLNRSVEVSRRQFERGECFDHQDVMRDIHAELQFLKEKGLVR